MSNLPAYPFNLKCRSCCWDDFSKADRFRMEDTRVAPGTLYYGLGTLDRVFGTIILIILPVSIAWEFALMIALCAANIPQRKGSEREYFSSNRKISRIHSLRVVITIACIDLGRLTSAWRVLRSKQYCLRKTLPCDATFISETIFALHFSHQSRHHESRPHLS